MAFQRQDMIGNPERPGRPQDHGKYRQLAGLLPATVARRYSLKLILLDAIIDQVESIVKDIEFHSNNTVCLAAPNFHKRGNMRDFPKLAAQVRGARALLGWSQAYLAEGINVRRTTIADLESCKHEPEASTLFALMNELTSAGIVFTETGVEFQRWPPNPYVPTGCARMRKRIRRKHSRCDAAHHLRFGTSV